MCIQSTLADDAADELSRKAADPTASLMSFNFIADYTGAYHGPDNGLEGDVVWLNVVRNFSKPNIFIMSEPQPLPHLH